MFVKSLSGNSLSCYSISWTNYMNLSYSVNVFFFKSSKNSSSAGTMCSYINFYVLSLILLLKSLILSLNYCVDDSRASWSRHSISISSSSKMLIAVSSFLSYSSNYSISSFSVSFFSSSSLRECFFKLIKSYIFWMLFFSASSSDFLKVWVQKVMFRTFSLYIYFMSFWYFIISSSILSKC